MPTINGGSQGDTVQNFVASSGANSSARRHYASFCTTGVCNFGINDLNTRTAVQINADADTYDVMLGIPNIWSTITPSATSTDNFATATGQIPAGFTVARGTVNDHRCSRRWAQCQHLAFGRRRFGDISLHVI